MTKQSKTTKPVNKRKVLKKDPEPLGGRPSSTPDYIESEAQKQHRMDIEKRVARLLESLDESLATYAGCLDTSIFANYSGGERGHMKQCAKERALEALKEADVHYLGLRQLLDSF